MDRPQTSKNALLQDAHGSSEEEEEEDDDDEEMLMELGGDDDDDEDEQRNHGFGEEEGVDEDEIIELGPEEEELLQQRRMQKRREDEAAKVRSTERMVGKPPTKRPQPLPPLTKKQGKKTKGGRRAMRKKKEEEKQRKRKKQTLPKRRSGFDKLGSSSSDWEGGSGSEQRENDDEMELADHQRNAMSNLIITKGRWKGRPRRQTPERDRLVNLGLNMYARLSLADMDEVSQEVLARAAEYMELYVLRYQSGFITLEIARHMVMVAIQFGAPMTMLKVPTFVRQKLYNGHTITVLDCQPINLRKFFEAMDRLEQIVGQTQWDYYYVSGADLFKLNNTENNSQQTLIKTHTFPWMYFRIKVISVLRTVHRVTMRRDWPGAAECIAKIPLHPALPKHATEHFKFLSRSMGPYLPSIHGVAFQCLLETRRPIGVLSQRAIELFNAFKTTSSEYRFWLENEALYLARLLCFHLVNLRLERRTGERDLLDMGSSARHKMHGVAEHRRVIMLLNYCIDVERHLMQLAKRQRGKKAALKEEEKIQDRSLINYFPNFLTTLFEDPHDAIGLLPMAVWGAQQFDCMEELTDKLLEACTQQPYLLLPVYNAMARFQMEHVVGQLLERLFDLCLELLPNCTIGLDLVEQRSLDPATYGSFDEVVGGNLRILFEFLDLGRNRADERAWALLYSNLCYIRDNPELMGAFVCPQWVKRKSWWPQFHAKHRVPLPRPAAKMRKRTFRLLNNQLGATVDAF